jgi:hypothetical protein
VVLMWRAARARQESFEQPPRYRRGLSAGWEECFAPDLLVTV